MAACEVAGLGPAVLGAGWGMAGCINNVEVWVVELTLVLAAIVGAVVAGGVVTLARLVPRASNGVVGTHPTRW